MGGSTTVVEVAAVDKTFRLRHTHSLKESVVWAVQGRSRRDDFRALSGIDLSIGSVNVVTRGWKPDRSHAAMMRS